MKRLHFNITVKGKVQGVFFRAYTKQKAEILGLYGFVINRKDGSVYIEAEGGEKALHELITWCHKGSPGARVDSVESAEAELKDFPSFKIEK